MLPRKFPVCRLSSRKFEKALNKRLETVRNEEMTRSCCRAGSKIERFSYYNNQHLKKNVFHEILHVLKLKNNMYFDADRYDKHTGHEYENILLSVQALVTFYSEQKNTLHVD